MCTCGRSEEHTSELQSRRDLVCRLLLEKKKKEGERRPLVERRHGQDVDDPEDVGEVGAVAGEDEPFSYPQGAGLGLYGFLFFFNDPAPTEIYTLSLHDALPIPRPGSPGSRAPPRSRSSRFPRCPRGEFSESFRTCDLSPRAGSGPHGSAAPWNARCAGPHRPARTPARFFPGGGAAARRGATTRSSW